MHSGQTLAVLKRKAESGLSVEHIRREKRMGDMAWQVTMAAQKLQSLRGDDVSAKERLQALHDDAKREYDRLQAEIEVGTAADEYGVFLG